MGEIINKVKSLDVITIDVKDFYAEGERAQIDLLDFLEGDILICLLYTSDAADE